MYQPTIVRRIDKTTVAVVARDLASQLAIDAGQRGVVVVASKPHVLLSCTRKYWNQHIAKLKREMSSTLNMQKRNRLGEAIAAMQTQSFISMKTGRSKKHDVCFITPEAASEDLVECTKVYVAVQLSPDELYMVTNWASRGLSIVIYEPNRSFLGINSLRPSTVFDNRSLSHV